MEIEKEYFGPLLPYVEDPEITDIDYNGRLLWLTMVNNRRYALEDTGRIMTPAFVEQFSQRIANLVSRQFNKRNPELEAETPDLRITIVHESVARSGRSISIRKTPPLVRITLKSAIERGFCSEKAASFLINCVRARMNMTFCGMPGAGKTECIKFFSGYIPAEERVITIEDTLEIRYSHTNPGKDCIEMRVEEGLFGYADAIKASLRLSPKWIMLSEARSTEVRYLLESWSTGVRGMTTLHTDDVRNVPDRIMNMMETKADADRIEGTIYQALDVGVLISCRKAADGGYHRYIDQICLYQREKGINSCLMVVEDGVWILDRLPQSLLQGFKRFGIDEPFTIQQEAHSNEN